MKLAVDSTLLLFVFNNIYQLSMNKSTRRIYQQLLIIFITFSYPFAAFSQGNSTYIIRGKIRNYDQTYFSLVKDAFLDWKNYNIVVDTKGNFIREIQTESLQDFILEFNNETYTFFAKPGDTITLTWDKKISAKRSQYKEIKKDGTANTKRFLNCLHLKKVDLKMKNIRLITTPSLIGLMLLTMKRLKSLVDIPPQITLRKLRMMCITSTWVCF
jgi:hypothetical protein